MGSSGCVSAYFMADLGPACGDPAPWRNRSRTLSPLLQFDFIEREGIEAPPTGQNKDNVYQCKKHSSAGTALRPLLIQSPSFLTLSAWPQQRDSCVFVFVFS